MTSSILRAAAALLLCGACNVQAADARAADAKVTVDIKAQPVREALQAFGEQTGLQVLFRSEGTSVDGMTAPAVSGHLSAGEALERLLANSGLKYEFVNERTVRIASPSALERPVSMDGDAVRSRGFMRLARGNTSLVEATSAQASEEKTNVNAGSQEQGAGTKVEEIVVTAQKRSERLQDVPIPVTAISADALISNNQVRLQDYYTKIPGLSYTPGLFGQPFLVIRGITSGASASINPLVGVMVDEVPYGSSTGLGGGGFGVPDIDPSDLTRIEVLRGPQGTLYGANNIGGLVKFVTVDPSTDAVSGRLQAGISSVRNGDEPGYNLRGSINVPLGDTWAVRASGFTRQDPGYIDDPGLGIDGTNRTDVSGGRLSALWRPSQALSLKLSALVQDSKAHGPLYVQPALGDLQQSFALPNLATKNRSEAYSATVTAKLGAVDLTTASGYSFNRAYSENDYTPFIGPALNEAQFGAAGTGTSYVIDKETEKYTQEIRLSAPVGPRMEILFGAFYTRENSFRIEDSILVIDPSTGANLGRWLDSMFPVRFTEYAAFTDLTVRVNDRFDVQIGGRESRGRLTYSGVTTGTGLFADSITPQKTTRDSAFTYLLTPRFKLSPELMAYARFASGYRPGGPNGNALPGAPSQYAPDKTLNYELGIKGDVLDHVVSLDASVYYIDWKDVQIQLREPVTRFIYYVNAGRAKSQGMEVSVTARPAKGLTITAWGALSEAQLTESFPATSTVRGAAGDRLPFSARFSGNLSIDQQFPLGSRLDGFAGASVSYVGDRKGSFTGGTGVRQELPAYTQLDLNAGVKRDSWTVNVYANNILDKRGVLIGGLGFLYTNAFNYIPPRTLGLSLLRTF